MTVVPPDDQPRGWLKAIRAFLRESFIDPEPTPRDLRTRKQVAALPVRSRKGGELDVLLITARRSGRLIIPRGWPMRGKPDHQAAGIEAEQEAGVTGRILEEPIGSYVYRKRGGGRASPSVPITVTVYLLDVERQLSKFREKGQRRLVWLSVEEAAKRVDEPGLVPIIRALPLPLTGIEVRRP